ncbi:hypothetical protein C8F01DRAFT_1271537 [Mycena amicta]|nr:hypothetical protein C8F01DRAFT_1271537 [Mycena amicta]
MSGIPPNDPPTRPPTPPIGQDAPASSNRSLRNQSSVSHNNRLGLQNPPGMQPVASSGSSKPRGRPKGSAKQRAVAQTSSLSAIDNSGSTMSMVVRSIDAGFAALNNTMRDGLANLERVVSDGLHNMDVGMEEVSGSLRGIQTTSAGLSSDLRDISDDFHDVVDSQPAQRAHEVLNFVQGITENSVHSADNSLETAREVRRLADTVADLQQATMTGPLTPAFVPAPSSSRARPFSGRDSPPAYNERPPPPPPQPSFRREPALLNRLSAAPPAHHNGRGGVALRRRPFGRGHGFGRGISHDFSQREDSSGAPGDFALGE